MNTIVHVDMDAFFAAVEVLKNPGYRGKPVIVGGDPAGRRGVVATCSYEARRYGVRSAMPMAEAVRRCPHAVFLRPDMKSYAAYSEKVHQVLQTFTPLIEPLSIDEAFLDMTGCEHFYDSPVAMGEAIKRAVSKHTNLTASVGIAHNKFIAKLASDLGKPDGLVVVDPKDVQSFLDPLPIARIWGVGPKTAERLGQAGVRTVRDLRLRSEPWLRALLGERAAAHLFRLSRGLDDRAVVPETESKSISRETTFEYDIGDPLTLRHIVAVLAADVGARLRRTGCFASTVQFKARLPDFRRISRQKTLPHAFDSDDRLYEVAVQLLEQVVTMGPFRLVGVGVSDLTAATQPSLFDDDRRSEAISHTLDRLREKYGERIVKHGRELEPKGGPLH